jgi:hypothetical protein
MSDCRTGNYGTWSSPITSDLVVTESLTLGEPRVDGDSIYWTEGRPSEGGRTVIVSRSANGAVREITPSGFDVRSRVHEYGGGAYQVDDGVVCFVNFADQQIYVQELGTDPRKLAHNDDCRYADLQVDRRRNRLVAIREERPLKGGEAINALVAIDLATGAEVIIRQGYDFYSSPALDPNGGRLAWLCWRHPHMPWISTCLMVAEFDELGGLEDVRLVAGGDEVSIIQPQWSPGGALYFVSDRTDDWNIYRLGPAGVEAVLQKEAEFGAPLWQFGQSTYAFSTAELREWRRILEIDAHGLAQIVGDAAAEPHRCDEAREIVVEQHQRGRLARDIGPASAHGDADMRGLERWRVIHAISRHGDDLARCGEGLNQAQLLFGHDAGEHIGVGQTGLELGLVQTFQFRAGQGFIALDAGLFRDGPRGRRMIARDHDYANAALRAGFDGGARLRTQRVGETDQPHKAEVEIMLCLWPCVGRPCGLRHRHANAAGRNKKRTIPGNALADQENLASSMQVSPRRKRAKCRSSS